MPLQWWHPETNGCFSPPPRRGGLKLREMYLDSTHGPRRMLNASKRRSYVAESASILHVFGWDFERISDLLDVAESKWKKATQAVQKTFSKSTRKLVKWRSLAQAVS